MRPFPPVRLTALPSQRTYCGPFDRHVKRGVGLTPHSLIFTAEAGDWQQPTYGRKK
jgi:hypothetical protein